MALAKKPLFQGTMSTMPCISLTASFTVFDYTRSQRRSYYRQPASHQTTSMSATSQSRAQSLGATDMTRSSSRPYTPSSDTGRHDIEAQIMEGGGMANVGSRGIGKQLDDTNSGIEMTPQPSMAGK